LGAKRCPRCGKIVPNYAWECWDCGWKFYEKECPRCGKIVPGYADECWNCGWIFHNYYE